MKVPGPGRRRELAALLVASVWLCGSAALAEVETYQVSHRLEEGGALLRETVTLRVLIENDAELERWRAVPVFLDLNRELVRLEAWAVDAAGERQTVRDRELDTVETLDSFELHSSSAARVVPFADLAVGGAIELEYEVLERPWYPAKRLRLLPGVDAASSVRFELSGVPVAVHFVLEGPEVGFEVERREGGLSIEAQDVEVGAPASFAPDSESRSPVLHYSWGGESWQAVGQWYRGLVRDVPPASDEVRGLARELTAGMSSPRDRLDALTAWIRSQIRYVAVEVGIGGFRPSPSDETFERRWGDCKDKSLLLIELLREAGLAAWPALIRLDPDDRIRSELASPFHFNHLIVAVEESDLESAPADPVEGGLFFIDPTQEVGAARWLHPGVQDQEALVVTADSSRMVRTPLLADVEQIEVDARLTLSEEGSASGRVTARWVGNVAVAIQRRFALSDDSANSLMVRDLLRDLVPRIELEDIETRSDDQGEPFVEVSARAHVRRFVRGRGDRVSLRLGQPRRTPSAVRLGSNGDGAERRSPVVLRPGNVSFQWHLELPEGYCAPEDPQPPFRNDLGEVREQIESAPGELTVRREVKVTRRWVDPSDLGALHALIDAETQVIGRRLRLACRSGP